MKIDFFSLSGGIVFCLFGITIIFKPTFYSSQYSFFVDLTGYNVPLGIFVFLWGLGIIWTAIKSVKKK